MISPSSAVSTPLRLGALYAGTTRRNRLPTANLAPLVGPVGLNGFKGMAKTRLAMASADLELLNMALGWSETTNIFKVRNVWHDVEFYVADNFRSHSATDR